MRRSILALFVCVGLWGCSGDEATSDSGVHDDAAQASDSGPPADTGTTEQPDASLDAGEIADAEVMDAAPPPDSGMSDDAGMQDTGVHADAAMLDSGVHPDAAPVDSGAHPDAAMLDSGVHPDAAPVDSGVHPDAAPVDSGVHPDAAPMDSGVHPDAAMPDSGVHPDAAVPDSGAPQAGCNPGCNNNAFCELPEGDCRMGGQPGICVVRPMMCSFIYRPVCGCDGMTYSNDCLRQVAGIPLLRAGGPCAP